MSVNKVNKTTGDLSLLAGGTLYADNPIGSIIPYGGATAPAGWFICDGTELVRATYPELFAVIGTSFGTPSDNTKFKLPDLREATTKGVGLTGKSNNHYDADGLALGEFIDDRVQEHNHKVAFKAVQIYGAGTAWGAQYDDSDSPTSTINPQTGRHGNTTEVKAVGVNYIIKAVSVGVPADFMSAVDEAISNIDTADITESSALSNIGTSANATQHAVNVAINDIIASKVGNDRYVGDFVIASNAQRIIRFPSSGGSMFMNLFFEGHNGASCGGVMLSGYNELDSGRIRGIYYVGSTSEVIVNTANYGVIIAAPSVAVKVHYEITSTKEPSIETAQPITISTWSESLYQVTNS